VIAARVAIRLGSSMPIRKSRVSSGSASATRRTSAFVAAVKARSSRTSR
jgi:hypothetical protein